MHIHAQEKTFLYDCFSNIKKCALPHINIGKEAALPSCMLMYGKSEIVADSI